MNRGCMLFLAVMGVALSLAAPCKAGGGVNVDTGFPAKDVAGMSELAGEVVPLIKEGSKVMLIAPGLDYYPLFAKAPISVWLIHLTLGRDPLVETQWDGWKKALPSPADSSSFRDGVITARIGKADISVSAIPQLPSAVDPDLVILDAGFFLPLYENEVRGGMIELSMKLFRTLRERKDTGAPLLILQPLADSAFPLQWVYLGEFWKDLWQHPEMFREELPLRWKVRKQAEFFAEFGQFEEATALLEDARSYFPKDGSIEFQLARLAFWDRETAVGIRYLNRAVRADRRFLRGYSEFGNYFISKERPAAAEMVLRAGLLQDKSDRRLNIQLFKLLLERIETAGGQDPEGERKDLEDALGLSVPKETRDRALILQRKLPISP